jgi:hypothetical protein
MACAAGIRVVLAACVASFVLEGLRADVHDMAAPWQTSIPTRVNEQLVDFTVREGDVVEWAALSFCILHQLDEDGLTCTNALTQEFMRQAGGVERGEGTLFHLLAKDSRTAHVGPRGMHGEFLFDVVFRLPVLAGGMDGAECDGLLQDTERNEIGFARYDLHTRTGTLRVVGGARNMLALVDDEWCRLRPCGCLEGEREALVEEALVHFEVYMRKRWVRLNGWETVERATGEEESAAQALVAAGESVPVFVIHYEALVKRRADLERQLADENMRNVEWILGPSRASLTDDYLRGVYASSHDRFLYVESCTRSRIVQDRHQHISYGPYRNLTASEMCTMISHVTALQKIVAAKSEAALILEDDAVLRPDLALQLGRYVAEAIRPVAAGGAGGFDFIFLGEYETTTSARYGSSHEDYRLPLEPGRHLYPRGTTRTADAYLVSWRGAEKALRSLIPFTMQIDWQLVCAFQEQDMQVFWAYPPLVRQGSFLGLFPSERTKGLETDGVYHKEERPSPLDTTVVNTIAEDRDGHSIQVEIEPHMHTFWVSRTDSAEEVARSFCHITAMYAKDCPSKMVNLIASVRGETEEECQAAAASDDVPPPAWYARSAGYWEAKATAKLWASESATNNAIEYLTQAVWLEPKRESAWRQLHDALEVHWNLTHREASPLEQTNFAAEVVAAHVPTCFHRMLEERQLRVYGALTHHVGIELDSTSEVKSNPRAEKLDSSAKRSLTSVLDFFSSLTSSRY